MCDKLRPGHLVKSTMGRDKGKYYLVLNVVSDSIVLVVNGRERKIDCPKKKNYKHLKMYPVVAEEIGNKLFTGERITNLELSRVIDTLISTAPRD